MQKPETAFLTEHEEASEATVAEMLQ